MSKHLSEQQIKELEKEGYIILSNTESGASIQNKEGEMFYQYSEKGEILNKAYNKAKKNR